MKKVKLGIQAADIVALVFLIIGGVFTLLGVIFAVNINAMMKDATGDPHMFILIFTSIGLFFLAGGFFALYLSVHHRHMVQMAVDQGQYVMADVDHIEQNTSVTVNGSSPFIIICTYQDPLTGDMHEFRSRNLFYYPKELLNTKIRVYTAGTNMKYYYVDMENALSDTLK